MRFNSRRTDLSTLPGVAGTARVARRAPQLLSRLREGDIAVIDHHDLDQRDGDCGWWTREWSASSTPRHDLRPLRQPGARGPGRGRRRPRRPGRRGRLAAVPDDQPIRIDDGVVYAEETAVAHGRVVALAELHEEMELARSGLAVQLDTLTHNASEFLRREQDLLLDGRGLPDLETTLARRPALVVAGSTTPSSWACAATSASRTRRSWPWARRPTTCWGSGGRPTSSSPSVQEPGGLPSADALEAASDVVLVRTHGAGPEQVEAVSGVVRLGLHPALVESSATPEDLALLLADRYDAVPLVGVGLSGRLEHFLDRREAGLASTFATRLKVGSRLVDASAVPALHTSGATTGQVVALLVAGIVAVSAAIAVTPVGQDVLDSFSDQLSSLL